MSGVSRPQVGVCILRVESAPGQLLITITTNRNLDRNLFSARPELAQRFADPEAAIEVAEEFLRSFG